MGDRQTRNDPYPERRTPSPIPWTDDAAVQGEAMVAAVEKRRNEAHGIGRDEDSGS